MKERDENMRDRPNIGSPERLITTLYDSGDDEASDFGLAGGATPDF